MSNADDCDDGNVDVHPRTSALRCATVSMTLSRMEALDDTTDPTVAPTWYLDSDGDG